MLICKNVETPCKSRSNGTIVIWVAMRLILVCIRPSSFAVLTPLINGTVSGVVDGKSDTNNVCCKLSHVPQTLRAFHKSRNDYFVTKIKNKKGTKSILHLTLHCTDLLKANCFDIERTNKWNNHNMVCKSPNNCTICRNISPYIEFQQA